MKITVPTIDFGTSKIVTMVAQSNGERCDIVGSGAVPYSGYLQDGWNNPDEIRDVIRTAIDQAQKTGNCRCAGHVYTRDCQGSACVANRA